MVIHRENGLPYMDRIFISGGDDRNPIHCMGQRNKQGGFTLVELLVVLVLMALALGLAFQSIGKTSDVKQAKIFAGELTNLLRKARASAVNTGGPFDVRISLPERLCRMEEVELDIPEPLRVEVRRIRFEENGDAVIRFHPDGGSSGGEILVYGPDGFVTGIRVDLFTGAIQKARETDDSLG